MPPDIELCSVQLPGRENRYRQPAFTDLKVLAEVLLTALTPLFDIPFGLFGHSMGALIGFEVARMCRRELNIEPAHLLISACRPPHLEKLAPIQSSFLSLGASAARHPRR
jgi:medium-chain acyl-[acyl-carrier-protein] hydrolase